MPADPDTIVAAARSWLGVPWRHQGRTRQGVDCAGLVVLVGRELGLADYDTTAYGRRPEGQGFVEHFRAAMDGVPLPEAGLKTISCRLGQRPGCIDHPMIEFLFHQRRAFLGPTVVGVDAAGRPGHKDVPRRRIDG